MAYPFLIRFSRAEALCYVAHLDMMRLWERAFRRSDIPVAYTQGFNPHIRFSLAVPLSVGMTSDAEYCEVFLDTMLRPQELHDRLSKELPEGIAVSEIRLSPYKGSPAAQVALIEYVVSCFGNSGPESDLKARLDTVLGARTLPYMKTNKNGTKEVDLRPFIQGLSLIEQLPDRTTLNMRLRTGPSGSIKPENVLQTAGITCGRVKLHRKEIYFRTAKGEYFVP